MTKADMVALSECTRDVLCLDIVVVLASVTEFITDVCQKGPLSSAWMGKVAAKAEGGAGALVSG
jgi:hypothetical protein